MAGRGILFLVGGEVSGLVIPDGECVVVNCTVGIITGDDGHIFAVEHPGGDGDGLTAKTAANDLFFVRRHGRVRAGRGYLAHMGYVLFCYAPIEVIALLGFFNLFTCKHLIFTRQCCQ